MKQPKPRDIESMPRNYQLGGVELCEEFDVPGASLKMVRKAFFRPVAVQHEESGEQY